MGRILKKIIDDANIKKQAEELGLPVWRTPSVLFIFMGIIIIIAISAVYISSQKYDNPEILIISEVIVTIFLFTIGNFIIQSVEQVAKLNKMKSEFVSIASHQLKAPLAEINWETELLLSKNSEGLNEKQKELAQRIAKSNNRMARLVNDLLDVARIEQGKLFMNSENIDLSDIIEKVVDNNQILARVNNVEIKFFRPEEKIEVFTDKRRIGVVLDNLVTNAIKYIRKKGRVEIRVFRKGNKNIVSVKDNGIGIPAHQQENVFEKFFRSENASQTQVSGTGLGLYIAKNIIEKSKGDIWFESQENIGSTFFFSLPINKSGNN